MFAQREQKKNNLKKKINKNKIINQQAKVGALQSKLTVAKIFRRSDNPQIRKLFLGYCFIFFFVFILIFVIIQVYKNVIQANPVGNLGAQIP